MTNDRGLRIRCVDVNEEKIASLNSGKVPIYEPGLDEILQRNARLGRHVRTPLVPWEIRSYNVVKPCECTNNGLGIGTSSGLSVQHY